MDLRYSKKSQLIILSGFLLISFLVYIYYVDVENEYQQKNNVMGNYYNVVYETCLFARNNSFEVFEDNFFLYSLEIRNFCNSLSTQCYLEYGIINSAPTNKTLWNYSHLFFNFTYLVDNEKIYINSNFTCIKNG